MLASGSELLLHCAAQADGLVPECASVTGKQHPHYSTEYHFELARLAAGIWDKLSMILDDLEIRFLSLPMLTVRF